MNTTTTVLESNPIIKDTWNSKEARSFILNFMLVTLWTASIRPINKAYESWFKSRARSCDKLMDYLLNSESEQTDSKIEEGLTKLSKIRVDKFENLNRSWLAEKIDLFSHLYFTAFDCPWSSHTPVDTLSLKDWPTPKTIFFAFGPHIGIGDEMILISAVETMVQTYPEAQIEIWSYSKTLWDWNPYVTANYINKDSLEPFKRAEELLRVDSSALVVFSDYASDKTYRILENVSGFNRFIYIDIGSQIVRLIDQNRKEINEFSAPKNTPTIYETLAILLNKIGVKQTKKTSFSKEQVQEVESSEFKILLNPHSSKSMPAVNSQWWADTLNYVGKKSKIKVTILAGINSTCKKFTESIIDKLNDKLVTSSVLPPGGLNQVFQAAKEHDMVFGLDTFSAHINTLFPKKCVTVFFGSSGASWKVPEAAVLNTDINDSPKYVSELILRLIVTPSSSTQLDSLITLSKTTTHIADLLTNHAPCAIVYKQLNSCINLIHSIFSEDKSIQKTFSSSTIKYLNTLEGVLGNCPKNNPQAITELQKNVFITAFKFFENSNLCRYAHYLNKEILQKNEKHSNSLALEMTNNF